MLELAHILNPARTLCRAPVVSKKRFFETAAELISNEQQTLSSETIFSSLLSREKLGSTALGGGVAIPHCRMGTCTTAVGSLITLAEPVDFEAPDRIGVDILFVLLVPEEGHQEHLDILAGLAGLLSQAAFCERLRSASSAEQLFEAAVNYRP
jgi:PTS system nitrogen regulatory IIA component